MKTYKAVIMPAPGASTGEEGKVELLRMEITFAIGSRAGRAPEDIIRGTLNDMHITGYTTIESITEVTEEGKPS